MTLTPWAIGVVMSLGGPAVDAAAQAAPPGQVAPQVEKCLHDASESAADKARREEALAAMRMIAFVLAQEATLYQSGPHWSDLTSTPGIRRLQRMEGRVGDLARRIGWGAPEPLPGWAMIWAYGPMSRRPPLAPPAVFSLTDMSDPCLFRYSSTDPEVMRALRPSLKLLRPKAY